MSLCSCLFTTEVKLTKCFVYLSTDAVNNRVDNLTLDIRKLEEKHNTTLNKLKHKHNVTLLHMEEKLKQHTGKRNDFFFLFFQ